LVEILDGDFHSGLAVQLDTDRVATGSGVIAKRGEEVAQSPFRGVNSRFEAEAFPVVVVVWVSQVLQSLGPVPGVGDLPTVQQEQGHRIKGFLTAGASPTQTLGQDRTQPGKVDEAQDQIPVGQMLPSMPVVEIVAAKIDIVGAV
jgi:hypothetical protein